MLLPGLEPSEVLPVPPKELPHPTAAPRIKLSCKILFSLLLDCSTLPTNPDSALQTFSPPQVFNFRVLEGLSLIVQDVTASVSSSEWDALGQIR